MTFKARKLSEFEATTFNFGALGIAPSRVPPMDRLWAIDEDRHTFFTQLNSTSHEMRDGLYFYLLLVRGNPALIRMEEWSADAPSKNGPFNVIIEKFHATQTSSSDLIRRLASEAQLVLIAERSH